MTRGYGQSATAHMGISYLDDGGGNDSYNSAMTMSAGAAHDFSVSLFVDENGDDQYHQTANCLGRSLNNSVALFLDVSGNDHVSRSGRIRHEPQRFYDRLARPKFQPPQSFSISTAMTATLRTV